MTNTKRRISSALIAIAMVAAVGTTTLAGTAGLGEGFNISTSAASAVTYVNSEGAVKKVKTYTALTSSNGTVELDGGCYVVNGVIGIKKMTVTKDSYIILCEDSELKVEKGIEVIGATQFNVYTQGEGSGTLYAGCDNFGNKTAASGKPGIGGANATVNLIGGRIFAKGGSNADGVQGETIRVYWTNPEDVIAVSSFSTNVKFNSTFADRDRGAAYNAGKTYKPSAVKGVTLSPANEVTSRMTEFDNAAYVVTGTVTNNNRITVTGTADLILSDNAVFTASEGITVGSKNTLNIFGTGKLYAGTTNGTNTYAASSYAGIGSEGKNTAGKITIKEATVYAVGGNNAAGIGGSGASVEIESGTVTAYGGSYAAGIGSSYDGKGADISIYGGKVSATGGNNAAGIGSGSASTASSIKLSYTNSSDFIYASSYSDRPELLKTFYVKETGETASRDNVKSSKNITLVTQPTGYTITFESNGGTYVSPITVNANNNYVRMPADPTRNGYTFGGWYTDRACTKAFNFSTSIKQSYTLYAKWVNYYTVSFESNGGTYISPVNVNPNSYMNAPDYPRKEGYLFDGWFTDRNLTKSFDYRNYRITGNMTLYAKWVHNYVTVTFNTQGGSYVAPQTIDYDNYAYIPTNPTKSGYEFIGWYTDKNGYTNFDFNKRVTKDTTVYAHWNKSSNYYTVRFVTNNGDSVADQIVLEGDTVAMLPYLSRPGYTFDDWYTNSSLTKRFDYNTRIYSNTTLYAGWIEDISYCTVNFDSMGGSYVYSRSVKAGDPIGASERPYRDGYEFTGWYTDYNCRNLVSLDMRLYEDITLYAGWKEDSVYYTIEYNTMGGSYVSPRSVLAGNVIGASERPYRDGYEFTGWYTDSGCYNPVDISTPVYSNIVLYAGWEKNAPTYHTVSFDSNGGSYVNSQIVEDGDSVTYPPAPDNYGYIFIGWYTDRAATNSYSFGSPVYKDMTLYAGWIVDENLYTDDSRYDSSYYGSTFSTGGIIAAVAGGVIVLGGAAAAIFISKKNKK